MVQPKLGAMLFLVMAAYNCFSQGPVAPAKNEVIYHIFQRSFYDSNGDLNGDFNGLRQKLGYMQDLGVTSLMLVPVFHSPYYHNYFPDDFERTDPAYGSKQDFIKLVKAVHKRGMKIYLDMETQYVTGDQLWYKDSYKNPKSKYSQYVLYNDSANAKPEPIVYNITDLQGYNGVTKKVATVNLYSKKVLNANFRIFRSFADPYRNGDFTAGVDGFRLDHMMDDLDSKGRLTNLFDVFWGPLLDKLRRVNPKLKIVAEQANWGSYGYEYFKRGHVDRVFAFNLQRAIAGFNKAKLARVADSTLNLTPEGYQQVVFIENHDMPRFATMVGKNAGKMRVGAALNLLIGGLPAIYYGQELGMFGGGGKRLADNDGGDIPQREAFEWYGSDRGKGMTLWYKDSGPWWNQTNLIPNDGVSLEEEQPDVNSLYNFYKTLLSLRASREALFAGRYQNISNDNDKVFSFLRYTRTHALLVMVNLSAYGQAVTVTAETAGLKNTANSFHKLLGNTRLTMEAAGKISGTLSPYDIEVLELQR